jgi:gluconokinase
LVIVLMGVAGAGKTTVGQLLAAQLGWEFRDADDYHSAANVKKMRSGIPLNDADRAPWLEALRTQIRAWDADNKNGVLACSALKQAYREILQVDSQVKFVYLKASPALLQERLRTRRGHYMSDQMLASQLATLEEPEHALAIDAEASPSEIVSEIRARIEIPQK